jgi:hypothetical protein
MLWVVKWKAVERLYMFYMFKCVSEDAKKRENG